MKEEWLEAEFPKFKFKNNKFTKSRGTPLMLKMTCKQCSDPVILYQKDGPGPLLRCYFDRIHYPLSLKTVCQSLKLKDKNLCDLLKCKTCGTVIGTPIIYEKEKRLAFHLIQETFDLIEFSIK